MADKKISQLSDATVPLAGTEVLPIVQGGSTVKVSVDNLTVGKSVSGSAFVATGSAVPQNGMFLPAANALGFASNGVERGRFSSTGNFGIGVNPTYKLQVAGTTNTVALGLTGTHASGDIGLYIIPSAITGSYNAINSAPSATTGVNYNFGNANNSSATADSRADIYTTSANGGDPKLTLSISGVRNWSVGVDNSASDQFCISASDAPGNTDRLTIDTNGSATIGAGSVATTATDGFLYVPTCAGTPTGTPTAKSGYAPIVVNTTNNKLYFYSGGSWRDAGP
jgi:hypothetical protein